MKIDIHLNQLHNSWWIGLGTSFQKTQLHPTHKYILTLEVIFFSIYFRFIKK